MRKYIVPLLALGALAVPGSALAQAPGPPGGPPGVPPAFAPPVIAPVTDVASAETFTENYVTVNAQRLLNTDRRRVRVTDANAACLQSPIVDTRFGCVFTLKALVINRNRGWDNWGHGDSRSHSRARSAGDGGHGHKRHDRNHQQRFHIQRFGCLGFLRVDGGPAVRPSGTLVNVECRRIHDGRDDFDVTEDVTPVT